MSRETLQHMRKICWMIFHGFKLNKHPPPATKTETNKQAALVVLYSVTEGDSCLELNSSFKVLPGPVV